jgi:hypothetical protein
VVHWWLRIADDCPRCGISLVRGNRVGAYILNLGVAEALTAGLIILVVVRSWPAPPWDILTWAAPLLAITAPLFFYPWSRLLFVAIDLAMHPGTVRDEDVGSQESGVGRGVDGGKLGE